MISSFPKSWPGPMEGVMHPAFVLACGELRLAEHYVTPFLRISSSAPHRNKLKKFLEPFQKANVPVTAQLMGVDPDLLASVAVSLAELGASAINFNFACPSRQVVNGGAGGGALRNPELMRKILQTTRSRLPDIALSAKIRSGFASPEELETILPYLTSDGLIDFVILHFRTVREQYLPVADGLSRLRRAVELAGDIPIVGNGDLRTARDAGEMFDRTGCRAVMCARGFLADPFLLRRIAGFSDNPAPEQARRVFFQTVLRYALELPDGGFNNGKAIELALFLWGRENEVFRRLKQAPPDQWRKEMDFFSPDNTEEITS